jgi:ATP-dependent DNA helicase RecQ
VRVTTSPHAASTTDVRASAEAHLRALVGRDDVSLREDQWTAIEAPASRSSRVATK